MLKPIVSSQFPPFGVGQVSYRHYDSHPHYQDD